MISRQNAKIRFWRYIRHSDQIRCILPSQTQEPRLHFTRVWIGTVASRCFSHPTLSLASEKILKDLKRSQGHQRGGKESELANWTLWTSPKFTIGVKYQFHQWFLTRSEVRKSQSTFALNRWYKNIPLSFFFQNLTFVALTYCAM